MPDTPPGGRLTSNRGAPTLTVSPRRRATGLVLAGLLGLSSLLAACGDDDEPSSSSDSTAGTSPEDVKVPMAEVLAGMPDLLTEATAAGAAAVEGDFDAVLERYEALHDVWVAIEGTVKDTDLDLYEAIETAQSLIKDGGESEDAERVATGVSDQADAVGSFIEGNS